MKVKDLIKQLMECNQESEVILQKDGEGNGYSPLSDVDDNAIYVPETTWSGSVYDTNWTSDEVCMGDKEWEEFKKKDKCVVLFPIN